MKRASWAGIILLCVLMPMSAGCQCAMQCAREWQSQTAGLNRDVELYDYGGNLIARWNTKSVIDNDTAGVTAFFDSTGNRIVTHGGILISREYGR